jgi:glyoxylase-like metal-dependent hydrolase (beta-lactamase superfamily II)
MTPSSAAFVARPPSGGAVELVPGVVWLRLPLPYALDHVNVWLLEEDDGWTAIDTGHGDEATRAAWDGVARSVLRGRPVRRVICTHHHPDHVGLSAWMARRWGAELWCTRTEWLEARAQSLRPLAETQGVAASFYRAAGVPGTELPRLLECCRSYPDNVSVAPSYHRIRDGDELLAGGVRWRVVVGRGHSPEHACLSAPGRGLFVSGDQVLPRISPNVSIWPSEQDEEPLGEFLASLETLRAVLPTALVLPSHGSPFTGLPRRCEELLRHHRARLDAVVAACDEPRTAWEVMAVLFERALDPHQTTFGIGEAMAHLNHLVAAGRLRRTRTPGKPDRYAAAAPRLLRPGGRTGGVAARLTGGCEARQDEKRSEAEGDGTSRTQEEYP